MQSKITIQVHKYSSKASLNKNVFKFFLKLGKDGERHTSDGNEFHKVAAANLKMVHPSDCVIGATSSSRSTGHGIGVLVSVTENNSPHDKVILPLLLQK